MHCNPIIMQLYFLHTFARCCPWSTWMYGVQIQKKRVVEYSRCRIGNSMGKFNLCFFTFHVHIISFHTTVTGGI